MPFIYVNRVKEVVARNVVEKKGDVFVSVNEDNGVGARADKTLYDRYSKDITKEEDLVKAIYVGLGGKVEDYATEEETKNRILHLDKHTKTRKRFDDCKWCERKR